MTDETNPSAESTTASSPPNGSVTTDGPTTSLTAAIPTTSTDKAQDTTLLRLDLPQVATGGGMVVNEPVRTRHPAHDILDEMEQELSKFDAYALSAFHGFLGRLRNAI